MPTPREYTMNFNFKLVYTQIVYKIEISSHASLQDLFNEAYTKFQPHIDYNKYYLELVVAGKANGELASALGLHNLDKPLWYEFGEKWIYMSFYIRPINRVTNIFHLFERYL